MLNIYRPSEAELAAIAREAREKLKRRIEQGERLTRELADNKALHARDTKVGDRMNAQELMVRARRALRRQMPEIDALAQVAGERPADLVKPAFGTPSYWLAHSVGWIGEQEVAADKALYDKRRRTSLGRCHRPAAHVPMPKYHNNSGAYVPQLSERVENDPRLSDGARRCARKLVAIVYRRNRRWRNYELTVPYLVQGLGRSVNTVREYLRQLRECGYIFHEVVAHRKTKMCKGIRVWILDRLLPEHHRKEWPPQKKTWPYPAKNGENPAPRKFGEKYSQKIYYTYLPVDLWTWRCRDGVYRSLMKNSLVLSAS